MPPWDRAVATPDLWPDELVDDITAWFDDLRGRWPDVEWWVRRVHEASASSRMPLLQRVNYVLITNDDFRAFASNPHGLMELGFRDPQLHTTVLPQLVNMPILRTFLAPLWAGTQTSLTLRASLNGITLDHQLVAAESGFYLRVTWEGSPSLVSQIEHMAISHTQQLHRHPTILTGGYIHNRGTTVFIPGGNRLIFSRKITLIGPDSEQDIEAALRGRFPDLAQENFVFAIFTSRFEFFGACHWTPVTQVWDILDLCGGEKGWVIYQRLQHHKVSVHQGDLFACYERCDSNAPFQADRPSTDIAQGWVANAPLLTSSEAAGSATLVPSVGDVTGSARSDASPTFENTGDPILLIGRESGRRRRDDRVVSFDIDLFQ